MSRQWLLSPKWFPNRRGRGIVVMVLGLGRVGTVTNLAARICGEAKSRQILTHRKTLSEFDQWVEAALIGELKLKGFSSFIPAFKT
jgi:class 3 adenylate cyclase